MSQLGVGAVLSQRPRASEEGEGQGAEAQNPSADGILRPPDQDRGHRDSAVENSTPPRRVDRGDRDVLPDTPASAGFAMGRSVKRVPIDPPDFDGNPKKAYRWLREFERIAFANRWDDFDRMVRLSFKLKKDALAWYDAKVEPNRNMTWNAVRELFIKDFCRVVESGSG